MPRISCQPSHDTCRPATVHRKPKTESRILTTGNQQRGFTLIELTVVIVILAIVALIVIPRLPSTQSARLRSSARSLAAAIRYLEDRSMTTKEEYRLRFDLGDNTITVTRRKADGDSTAPEDPFLGRRLLGEGVKMEDILVPQLGKVAEGEVVVPIGPAGIGSFLTVHLKGSAGDRFTVQAFPAGGKVKVLPGYEEPSP